MSASDSGKFQAVFKTQSKVHTIPFDNTAPTLRQAVDRFTSSTAMLQLKWDAIVVSTWDKPAEKIGANLPAKEFADQKLWFKSSKHKRNSMLNALNESESSDDPMTEIHSPMGNQSAKCSTPSTSKMPASSSNFSTPTSSHSPNPALVSSAGMSSFNLNMNNVHAPNAVIGNQLGHGASIQQLAQQAIKEPQPQISPAVLEQHDQNTEAIADVNDQIYDDLQHKADFEGLVQFDGHRHSS